jgi:hypothetical protein
MTLSEFLKQYQIDDLTEAEIRTLLGGLATYHKPAMTAVVEATFTAATAELSESNQLRLMAILLGML